MASGALVGCSPVEESVPVPVTLNVAEKGAPVSPSMYGVFFEEINHAGDGGLYAELVQNRSFEEHEMPEGYYVENGRLKPAPVHMTYMPCHILRFLTSTTLKTSKYTQISMAVFGKNIR